METEPKQKVLAEIKSAAQRRDYALRPHAVSHMFSEGFCESDIVEAIQNGRVLEWYMNEARCLIVGSYFVSQTISESLHVVVDYWTEPGTTGSGTIDWIDIVTAYVPRRPFWETPHQRGRNK